MDNAAKVRYRQTVVMVIYWTVYLVVFSLIQGLPSGNVFVAFRNELISLAPKIIFVAIVADRLDKVLAGKKIIFFVVTYLALLVVFAFALRLIDNYIILKYYLTWWKKEPLLSAPPFLYNAVKLQFLAAIPFIIKIYNDSPRAMPAQTSEPKTDAACSGAFLLVKSERRIHRVPLEEIMYLESRGNYLLIFTEKEDLKTYMPISEAEKKLPGRHFTRVHRSFIIASEKMDSFDSTHVRVKGRNIPIGRSYQLKARAVLQLP
jgi:hypothetical protein